MWLICCRVWVDFNLILPDDLTRLADVVVVPVAFEDGDRLILFVEPLLECIQSAEEITST